VSEREGDPAGTINNRERARAEHPLLDPCYAPRFAKVVRAESDDELVSKVEAHVGQAHPEMVGKLSRDDILGMAGEA
jgi:hypothetical protein